VEQPTHGFSRAECARWLTRTNRRFYGPETCRANAVRVERTCYAGVLRSLPPGDHVPEAQTDPAGGTEPADRLLRGIGLWQATALNMIDMIGVGPFITLPLIVASMHGPQAMLGWVLGALLVMCDGLVWAELGASLPEAGGPVRYLRAM